MLNINKLNNLNSLGKQGGLPWFSSGLYFLNSERPTLIADFLNRRFAEYDSVTNQYLYSQEFDNAYWGKTRSSATANTTTAPDGTATADSFIEDGTAASTHALVRTVTGPANVGDPLTVSVYFKANGRAAIKIAIPTAIVASSPTATFRTQTMTVSTSGTVSRTSFEELPNGWYRVSVSCVATSAGGSGNTIFYLDDGSTDSYNGDGVSGVYLWGAQLQFVASIGQYVPTTGSTVTTNFGLRGITDPLGSIRTTNATMFNSSGRLVWAPANMFTYSDALTNSYWTKTDTTLSQDGTLAPSGKQSYLATEGSAGTALITRQLTLPALTPSYFVTEIKKGNHQFARVGISSGGDSAMAWVDFDNGTITAATITGTTIAPSQPTITALADGWFRVVISSRFNIANPAVFVISAASSGSYSRVSGGTHYIGRMSSELYDGAGPKLPNVQTIGTAYYGSRYDYEPSTLTPKGIQIEVSRTNSLLNSAMVGGVAPSTLPTAWQQTAVAGVTFTYAYGTENGIPYIDVTASGTNTTGAQAYPSLFVGAIAGQVAALNGQTWTGSVYARKIAGADSIGSYVLQIRGRDAAVSLIGGQANSQALAVGGVSLNTSRNTVTYTFTSAAVAWADLIVVRTVAIAETMDITLRIGGSQLEQGADVSSHIPTYGASSTRGVDGPALVTDNWYTPNQGTLFAKFSQRVLDSTSAAHPVVYLSPTGRWSYSLAGPLKAYDGTNIAVTTSYTAGTTSKTATAINGVTMRMSHNNAVVNSVAFDGTMGSGTSLALGNDGPNALNGWIQEVRYYQSGSASDAQVQALTV